MPLLERVCCTCWRSEIDFVYEKNNCVAIGADSDDDDDQSASGVMLSPISHTEPRDVSCCDSFSHRCSRFSSPSDCIRPTAAAAAAAHRHLSPLRTLLGSKTPLLAYTPQPLITARCFLVPPPLCRFISRSNHSPCIQTAQSLSCSPPHLLPPPLLPAYGAASSGSSGTFPRNS